MTERLKWQVVSERWWDDDEKRNRWGYNVICPHCGPEMEWTGFTKIRTWKDAMALAVMEAKRRLGMGVTMTDCKKLDLAREWAKWVKDNPDVYGGTSDRARAAADLISSLPDGWVDANKVRDVIHKATWQGVVMEHMREQIVDDLEALLPAPPAPRTMGEIEWSDEEHHLAEALFGDTRKVVMLARDTDEEGDWSEWIHCRMEDGSTDLIEKEYLTPTGRKYRLEPDENVPKGDPIEPDFDPTHAYRDTDGNVWRYEEEAWWCYLQNYRTFRGTGTPSAEYAPFTRIEDAK